MLGKSAFLWGKRINSCFADVSICDSHLPSGNLAFAFFRGDPTHTIGCCYSCDVRVVQDGQMDLAGGMHPPTRQHRRGIRTLGSRWVLLLTVCAVSCAFIRQSSVTCWKTCCSVAGRPGRIVNCTTAWEIRPGGSACCRPAPRVGTWDSVILRSSCRPGHVLREFQSGPSSTAPSRRAPPFFGNGRAMLAAA